jgi:hypothetical protein
MGKYLHRRDLPDKLRAVLDGDQKRRWRIIISGRGGQALAVKACLLCKIW